MKKKIVIMLIILIVIGLAVSGGYFVYKEYRQQDPFELEWVRIYYDYMRENHEILKVNQNGLKYYRENEKIEFCEIESITNPVMLYNYKELGVSFTNVFYINDDNKVELLKSLKKDFNAEYLYDVEEKTYDYYIHEVNGNEEKYSKISECIKANKVNENQGDSNVIQEINIDNVVTLKTGEKISVTTVDEKMLEILKFDLKFIKTTIVEDNWKDINFDNYEDGIKKDFSVAVKNMKKVLTGGIREEVSQKESEIKAKKEEMTKAIEEIEMKQKEEEERKRAEEEARKKAEEEARKRAEEEAIKKAEEEAKKAEEETRRLEEEQRRQEESQNRDLYIKIWNI